MELDGEEWLFEIEEELEREEPDFFASATTGLIARARLSIATLKKEVRDLVMGSFFK